MVNQEGGVQAIYQAALDQGRFEIQRCNDCGDAIFFPRELCPGCGSGDLSWFSPSGKGTVYAVTTVRRKPEAGGDYNVSLINLEENVRLMSRIENAAPEEVKIGMAVKARVTVNEGHGLLVFHAMEGAAQ
ncbi:Zn-ribbon domain-containing OB-fold protein [Alloalcanivorax xenomutans]|uniref:Zn-ribbon domain-containing OB-fold protein n=1 Tax=Alloalcanivorax xenomutans TaxID=1094342 RepID=UPI003BAC9DEA